MKRWDCIVNPSEERQWEDLLNHIETVLNTTGLHWKDFHINFQKEDPSLAQLKTIRAYLDDHYGLF